MKVLVVDDSQDTIMTLKLALEEAGYETACACNGQEGYQKAKEILPDLILLDVMMAIMDGHTMNRLLKEDPQTKDIPVIMISAKRPADSLLSTARKHGIRAYFTKPFAFTALIAKIDEIFSGAPKTSTQSE